MTLQPYEFTARWKDDGSFSGGQTLRRNDATGQIVGPLSIGQDTDFPYSFLGAEINAGLGAQVTDLSAQLATARGEAAAKDATIQQQAATIAQMQAQLDALTATPTEPDLLTQLNAAFEAAIPPEARGAFAEKYAIVRILVQAGQAAMARHVIEETAVLPELEAAKAQLLAFFQPS